MTAPGCRSSLWGKQVNTHFFMPRQCSIYLDPCAKKPRTLNCHCLVAVLFPSPPSLMKRMERAPWWPEKGNVSSNSTSCRNLILHVLCYVLQFSSVFKYWWNLHVNRLFASYGPICFCCEFFTWSRNYNWLQAEMLMTSLSGDQGFRWEIRCWSRWTSSEQRSWCFVNIHCLVWKYKEILKTEGRKITNYTASFCFSVFFSKLPPGTRSILPWLIGTGITLLVSLASLGPRKICQDPLGFQVNRRLWIPWYQLSRSSPCNCWKMLLGGICHTICIA